MNVAIAVVPRERFSFTRTSLENLYANTRHPFELVYVDGGAPPEIRDYLADAARERGFQLVRREYILTPNEARNIALAQIQTEYIVFVDNDITVETGWLEKLVRCAEETGAWIVGPLYMIGPPGTDVIHMAGGDMGIEEEGGRRVFHERHLFKNQPLADHREEIRREPIDMVEFHTMLVRRDVFDRLGPLDEGLMSAYEHADICMLVREAGGEVYLEPASKVTYTPARAKGPHDLAFHLLRWSSDWNDRTLDCFAEKWRLERYGRTLRRQRRWLSRHRRKVYRWFGVLDPILQPAFTRSEARRRQQWRSREPIGSAQPGPEAASREITSPVGTPPLNADHELPPSVLR
jgi:GT2 family glycosyltransferase